MADNNKNTSNIESQHPEGIEIAIEILQNIPEGMLEEYMDRIGNELEPGYELYEIWCDLVEDYYGTDKK